MRTEVITADSIDAAVERVLDELVKEEAASVSRSGREHVVYFDGWDGLGASAVLRAVAALGQKDERRLRSFHRIIHLDCSKWESRRALQRSIAEQLQLPAAVMGMFERQDEEDDYNGVARGSRAEIPQVLEAMYQRIQELGHRFLLIFHNGGSEEIDLSIFGFPLFAYSTNKVLWTFQGRFRLYPRAKVDRAIKSTDVFLSASSSRHDQGQDPRELWSGLVLQEAAEVVASKMISTTGGINLPSQQFAADCFMHMLRLSCMSHFFSVDYDLATHSCNYWICDDILQLQQAEERIATGHGDDAAGELVWRAAGVVHDELRFDVDNQTLPPFDIVMCCQGMLSSTSSFHWFLPVPAGAIPNVDMFQHFDKLRVLKLYCRTFSLSSPPFLYCHNLKFLWLDRCYDEEISTDGGLSRTNNEDDISRCLQRLWVLDVRYTRCDRILSSRMLEFMTLLRELNLVGVTYMDVGQLQGRLPNIRKLRVTKSTVGMSPSISGEDLFSGMEKMELLDISGIHIIRALKSSNISTSSNQLLETVTVADGCVSIEKLSFRGCVNLKNLLLKGLFEDLRILDLSGTALKTLDLSAMTARGLDELTLDGCQELCAILWPPEDKRRDYLKKLHVDTTSSATSLVPGKEEKSMQMQGSTVPASANRTSSTSLSVVHGGRAPSEFYWRILVKDTRLLRSLVPFEEYFDKHPVHVEISSPIITFASSKDDEVVGSRKSTKKQHVPVNMDKSKCIQVHADVAATFKDHRLSEQASKGDGDGPALTWVCPCPSMPSLDTTNCYTYIQDSKIRNTKSLQLQEGEEKKSTTPNITMPDIICGNTEILHVHDSLSITSISCPAPAQGSRWHGLDWCRVERCPKLEYVFPTPPSGGGQQEGSSDTIMFENLKTLWASQLPKACFIWNLSTSVDQIDVDELSFKRLELLHLDLCPCLKHVLPLSWKMIKGSFLDSLQILEIVWCSDLRAVFPFNTTITVQRDRQDPNKQLRAMTLWFRSLKHLHLHELPKLQGICGHYWRLYAPQLKTVKIRGCWCLKSLPSVSSYRGKDPVECDCEKEWWDKLEWDGLAANHHPSLYKPTLSRYYKTTSLRSSVLR